jgi:probable O-glycosylation ligase (exosortase A-associated)
MPYAGSAPWNIRGLLISPAGTAGTNLLLSSDLPMRDYLIVGILLASLPVGLTNPYYGVLVYAWVSYMNPHLLAWSFAQTFPAAKIAAISALLGTLMRGPDDTRPIRKRENLLLIGLMVCFTLSSVFALYPNRAWTRWLDMLKIIAMALLTSVMLTDRLRFRYFFLVIAGSIGFYGIKGGIFSFVTGGESMIWGPEGSIIGANNAIGLALNMCLPLFWYMAKDEKKLWLRRFLQAAFVLSIPSIMFTYSRASALAMGIVLLLLMLRGRRKVLLLVTLLLVAMLAIPFLPREWVSRQESTLEYQQDMSAMSRLELWRFCWRVWLHRPLFGGGFELYSFESYARYYPEFLGMFPGKVWSAHSIYFGTLAESGIVGFTFLFGAIGCSLVSLSQISHRVAGFAELKWLANYSAMLQVSMIGFLVNGAFVDMAHFDLIYHWIGVVAGMRLVMDKELATVVNQKHDQPSDAAEPLLSNADGAPAKTEVFRPGAALRGR